MSSVLRQAVENRRMELINKLIAYGVYKKDETHLFQLSLTDLEIEYKKFQEDVHPHSELGSIRWNNKKF